MPTSNEARVRNQRDSFFLRITHKRLDADDVAVGVRVWPVHLNVGKTTVEHLVLLDPLADWHRDENTSSAGLFDGSFKSGKLWGGVDGDLSRADWDGAQLCGGLGAQANGALGPHGNLCNDLAVHKELDGVRCRVDKRVVDKIVGRPHDGKGVGEVPYFLSRRVEIKILRETISLVQLVFH